MSQTKQSKSIIEKTIFFSQSDLKQIQQKIKDLGNEIKQFRLALEAYRSKMRRTLLGSNLPYREETEHN